MSSAASNPSSSTSKPMSLKRNSDDIGWDYGVLVKPCQKSSEEDKEKCNKAIDDSKKDKKARYAEQQEVRDAVDLVGASDADEDTTAAEVEEIDCVSFNKINNVEFDQLLEAAGRFGPGGKKPN
ncbi:hypothetical protein E2562_006421 [Oryza meyeriana var. granulata]|uniref:Uncharacterized protein n=1 Tax=Oryza meyeriana var. granulata TaxID=110450 RepID=A0A6G1EFK6_9ORYZ|nr:hypothetical protein E2562_006421 [Oryza meyeriana var. granulata]